ncbi:MAG: Bug family tripartite tricarboxylate transporter substrate binding protein [Burkholderiales bacterium]
MKSHKLTNLISTSLALALLSVNANAQNFPQKPVRIIVPFPAGGAVDTGVRLISQKLGDIWKQTIIIDNRAGAGGNIGTDAVAKAAADGYTLLGNSNAIALSPALYRKLPYDATKDFTPVAQLTSSYLVLAVNPKLPAATVNELLEYVKIRPGQIAYGSNGIGVSPHLVTEQLMGRAGIEMLHVPYKGDAQAIPALLSGEVLVAIMPPSAVVNHVKAGKLRALAVTKLTRTSVFPGVPTIAESLPGFEYSGYIGLYAPAGLPREILARMQSDTSRVLAMADLQERLAAGGFEPPNTTPDQFAARYLRDIATFIQIVRDAKIPQQD